MDLSIILLSMAVHRHRTPLRGVKAIPRPREGRLEYGPRNYEYSGREGRIHETMEISGRTLAKVGFSDRKIVYYYLEDLELDRQSERRTFHDDESGTNE
jgi:hypothetical protein